jgi:hydrogenase maturation protein HypF
MGRLFDAVAALAGVRQAVSYEAQAAIELEALASGREPAFYPFQIGGGVIDPAPMLAAVIEDLRRGVPLPVIAARFHTGVARMTLDVCLELRRSHDLNDVALSGGVWQNTFLLALTVGLLQQEKFHIHLHRQVPANDGGLALGQAVVAIATAAGGN